MSKDPNKIAAIEKAISEKYGKETIQNPRGNWNEEKEKDYIEQSKHFYKKQLLNDEWQEKIHVNGIKISKKLLNRETTKRVCPVCKTYSFKIRDDVFMNKFDCCYNCYMKWIEGGREERWLSGWRPNQT